MRLTRKDFLIGVGGLALGAAGGRLTVEPGPRPPSPTPEAEHPAEEPKPGRISYAQAGEDLVVHFLFSYLQIADMSYLDIGAYDPVLINNTFFFYELGHRGVLVEPNVTLVQRLRAVRPEDTTLEAGIGVDSVNEADFYVMSEPSWSTFDREEAEHQTRVTEGKIFIKEVRRLPLLNVNDVMAEHFGGKAPAFVSIDAEGWHFAILKSIDFRRFRPKVICVETLVSGENRVIPEIPAFMETRGYVDRGGSFVNTVFVDSQIL